MFRKSAKTQEKALIDAINLRGNANKCGECSQEYPTWASVNLGILLCGRCANCHKKVLSVLGPRGGQISRVKSLTLELWNSEEIENLKRIGNKRARDRWNPKRVPFPVDDNDDFLIEEFLREKYILQKFRDDIDDGGDEVYSRNSDDSSRGDNPGSRRSRAGLRLTSTPLPRLSHRKLTQYEQTQHQSQLRKIMSLGFSDRDAVLESLLLSQGNIETALDILDLDDKLNPSKTERPPELPKRPQQSTAPATAPAATNGSPEWWTQTQANSATASAAALAQPQIYQYTDPVTGQILYIDSNGQQYLDPNNPQHQQMLMQQTNPQFAQQQTAQLQAQATRQNILLLYGNQTLQQSQQTAPAQNLGQQPTGFAGYPTGYQNQQAGQFQQMGQFQQQGQAQQTAQFQQPGQFQQSGQFQQPGQFQQTGQFQQANQQANPQYGQAYQQWQ